MVGMKRDGILKTELMMVGPLLLSNKKDENKTVNQDMKVYQAKLPYSSFLPSRASKEISGSGLINGTNALKSSLNMPENKLISN